MNLQRWLLLAFTWSPRFAVALMFSYYFGLLMAVLLLAVLGVMYFDRL